MVVVRAKVDPIDRDIELMLSELFSDKAKSNMLATFAIASVGEVSRQNESILGSQVDYKTFVDGVPDVSEFRVKPDGEIIYEFELVADTLAFIGRQLEMNSPVLSGAYRDSHTLFADGIEVDKGMNIPVATEYTFVSTLPYARKIEHGYSSQAPNGVYELTAHQARAIYGNIAKIDYVDYIGVFGVMAESPRARYGKQTKLAMNRSSNRYPAIRITLGGR